ncbi:MAG: alpha/beta hydrolase [Acidimicrobiaceae bacterium]|nr:alpha/beta hydrolase [Acidimicrobiaceae bacterium]MXW74463.1 alpha/beta hydrolase [Acidimicrobiaceae bacterium]MYA75146.1 alpha/beta hydrolase [Acidimicrobiaceae bacterium]MYC43381.1 alpha/beta hydrolase [Acidimicrobiaceae bacterium]MYD07222.1 alpha/beta hydrolase [Acidimicrobiaceae bacterium]
MTERPYDPELLEILPFLPSLTGMSNLEEVVARRKVMGSFFTQVDPRDDVIREDRAVPGLAGDPDVPIRIYRPESAPSGLLPAVLEIHGGGFMVGSIEMMDPWCDRMAAALPAVVVSVEYRLAPEDPFPAAVHDCYAALSWLADNAADLGVDPERIAIAGQSAGGGLAAGTALMARDRGGPPLCFQLLEIPELDHRLETPSMTEFTDTPLWNRPNAIWSWKHYLGPDHEGPVSPYASPSVAEDLSGLPSAFVSVMEFDPLRDEGLTYAMRLLEAGVSTEIHAYPGTFHGSSMVATAQVSLNSARDASAALRKALGT